MTTSLPLSTSMSLDVVDVVRETSTTGRTNTRIGGWISTMTSGFAGTITTTSGETRAAAVTLALHHSVSDGNTTLLGLCEAHQEASQEKQGRPPQRGSPLGRTLRLLRGRLGRTDSVALGNDGNEAKYVRGRGGAAESTKQHSARRAWGNHRSRLP